MQKWPSKEIVREWLISRSLHRQPLPDIMRIREDLEWPHMENFQTPAWQES
jgi:hypothetical protein